MVGFLQWLKIVHVYVLIYYLCTHICSYLIQIGSLQTPYRDRILFGSRKIRCLYTYLLHGAESFLRS